MKARSWFLPRDTGGEAFIPRDVFASPPGAVKDGPAGGPTVSSLARR